MFEPAVGDPVEAIKSQWVPIYREVDKVTKHVSLTKLPAGTDLSGGKMVITLAKGSEEGGDAFTETKTIGF